MRDHRKEDLRIQGVSNDGEDGSRGKEKHVDCEYGDGNPVKPNPIVREIMEQEGHDPGAHGDGEPSGGELVKYDAEKLQTYEGVKLRTTLLHSVSCFVGCSIFEML